MKNKNTIESLKKEGKIKLASEIIPLEDYVKKHYNTTMDKFNSPLYMIDKFDDQIEKVNQNSYFDADKINKQIERLKTLEMVEDYCSSLGITPNDLIQTHMDSQKKRNLKAKTTPETHVSDNPESGKTIKNKNHSNWREDYIQSKTIGK